MPVGPAYQPAPRFDALGEGFFDPVAAASFPRHTPRFRNQRWAARVGLDALTDDEWALHFARFQPLPGNLPAPLALRYHGHQFGSYNPRLGDGRGFLFAQLRDAGDGRLLDLGTKGSGQTPWSRGGDGRLTLKGGVREVLATEMLEALGVYTSKSFSLFETGEKLYRGDEPSPTRSSVLVRLSHSHVRFGSFQRHAFEGRDDRVKQLLEFTVANYFPALAAVAPEGLPAAFLREVCARTAELCASWMVAGFVHGVLNTDNMNVTGESFDYGPYRFLPVYDPAFIAAYFDEGGLYAFSQQPRRLLWNLARLAEALLGLGDAATFEAALEPFESLFGAAMRRRFVARLGLLPRGVDEDDRLLELSYAFLRESRVGYDQFFFDWFGGAASEARARSSPEAARYAGPLFASLREHLAGYAPARAELLAAPYYQGARPCTLLIDEIEALWQAIDARDDWSPFEQKVAAIRAMGALHGHGPG